MSEFICLVKVHIFVHFKGSLPQRHWRQRPRSSPTPLYHSSLDRFVPYSHIHHCLSLPSRVIILKFDSSNLSLRYFVLSHNLISPFLSLCRLSRGVRHRDSNCSWLGRSPHHHDISPKTPGRSHSPSITFSESSLSLSQRKAKVKSFSLTIIRIWKEVRM